MAEAMAGPPRQQAGPTTTILQQQQQAVVGTNQAGQQAEPEAPTLTLRLRPRPSVTWGADVINNEGMGKKSSKREFEPSYIGIGPRAARPPLSTFFFGFRLEVYSVLVVVEGIILI